MSESDSSPSTPQQQAQQQEDDNASVFTQVQSYSDQLQFITSQEMNQQQTQMNVQNIQKAPEKKSFFQKLGLFSSNKNAEPASVSASYQQQKKSGLFGSNSAPFPRRILTEGWNKKPPCAVIVTIYSASSYDALFRAVPQQSPDPDYSIAVFEMDYPSIRLFLLYVENDGHVTTSMMPQSTIDAIKDIVDAIKQVESDSVVFNFECCSYCDENGFKNGGGSVMQLVHHNIENGYMTMFGDFSVKALIHDWNPELLGPLPFERLSLSCSNSMLLAFDSAKLLECPSAQLQNVGKLHEGINTAELHCMGGTVVYSLREDCQTDNSAGKSVFEVEVLTIATKVDGMHVTNGRLSIDRYTGHAGHILLTYHNSKKGKILVSAGHWIELSQMGAETERMFSAMKEQYGAEYEQQLRTEWEEAGSEELRSNLVQRNCRQLVQSSAPCNYSKRKY